MRRALLALLATAVAAPVAAGPTFSYKQVFATPSQGGVAEIPAYDPVGQRIFVAAQTGVQIVDAKTGAPLGSVALPAGLGTVNSVAVKNGRLAVAVEASAKTDPGKVLVYRTNNLGAAPQQYTVGSLPDMLTFTPDGSRILVANEGEPNSYGQAGSVDPEGSVSVINVAAGTVQTAGFGAFNAAALRSQGVRIFGPGATAAQDLEPEYIAVAPDGKTAFVTLQENNALGVIDLEAPGGPAVVGIKSLGFKDFTGKPGSFKLDPSDQDGPGGTAQKGNLQSKAGLYGLYQSDSIATFTVNGQTYLVTADEGDAREWAGVDAVGGNNNGDEQRRIGGPASDPFRRLNVTELPGMTGGMPDDATLYTLGGRGFTIRTADGTVVYDSGDFIERFLAENLPALLDDGRSDNKGPEPEDVKVGIVGGRTLLFVGLERANQVDAGTVMVFDLSDFMPGLNGVVPQYLGLITSSDLSGPEGLAFFTSAGRSFLAVADEVSKKTVLFEVSVPEPAAIGLLGLGVLALAARRRKDPTPASI